MQRWLPGVGLATCALLAACDGDATSPSYTLDLAEIAIEPPSRALSVPDSAFVGEPFRITAFAIKRGCDGPGGLSVTQSPGRLRIVGVAIDESPPRLSCAEPISWSQATTATPTVDGPLTIVLIGRAGDRTDSVSRVVRVLPRRTLQASVAARAPAPAALEGRRSGAE